MRAEDALSELISTEQKLHDLRLGSDWDSDDREYAIRTHRDFSMLWEARNINFDRVLESIGKEEAIRITLLLLEDFFPLFHLMQPSNTSYRAAIDSIKSQLSHLSLTYIAIGLEAYPQAGLSMYGGSIRALMFALEEIGDPDGVGDAFYGRSQRRFPWFEHCSLSIINTVIAFREVTINLEHQKKMDDWSIRHAHLPSLMIESEKMQMLFDLIEKRIAPTSQ